MAKKLKKSQDKRPPSSKTGATFSASSAIGRLSFLTGLFLVIEIAAIGTKGWHDVRRETDLEKRRLLTEIKVIEEQVSQRRSQFETALALAQSTGLGTLAIESRLKGADRVFRVSPEGPRASLAEADARTLARWLAKSGETIGATKRSLIVLVKSDGQTFAAVYPLAKTLPALGNGEARSVQTKGLASMRFEQGPTDILQKVNSAIYEFDSGFDHLWNEYTQACSDVSGTALEVCQVSTRPWFSALSTSAIVIYSLLIIAPVLAVMTILQFMKAQIAGRREDAPGSLSGAEKLSIQSGISGWEVDEDLSTIKFSGQIAEWLNLKPEQKIPLKDLRHHLGDDMVTKFVPALSKACVDGRLRGVVPISFSNHRRFIEFRGIATNPGAEKTGLAGHAIDVTERRAMEERMRASELRLRNALQGFSMPVAIWDERKRLIFSNTAFESTFGFEEGSVRPGTAYDVVNMEIGRKVRIDRKSDSQGGERELQLYDNRWLAFAERETLSGLMVTVGTDITPLKAQRDQSLRNEKQLKRLISELERSEGRASELTRKYSEEKTKAEHASQAKGSFLANMSHELRTPLNAINGFSEMLVKEVFGPLGDERYQSYAQDILVSGQHLLDMINDILDMAKIESGKMTINTKPIDPVEPVDAAIRMIRRKADEKSITLQLKYDDDVREIEADHRAVRQMVLNLVSNAIKFTPDNGKVTVEIRNFESGIAIDVRDTGVGIDKKDLPRLANPFEQVEANQDMNPNGTGLGLALTRSLAEMHGGRFMIDSELGKGTIVTLVLPAQQPDETSEDEAA